MTSPPPTSSRRSIDILFGPAPVVVLLVCYFALGLSASSRKTVTGDEGTHLLGGYSYWAFNDYHLNPESGNWVQRWATLPVGLAGYKFPNFQDANGQLFSQYELARQFLFDSGNDPDRMLLLARTMIGLLGVALGLIVYIWSRHLFGPIGGLISLTLYAFSPTMLTHGFLALADLSVTFFILLSVGALWMLMRRISLGTLALSSFALTGALLSKVSGAAVIPAAALMIAIRLWNSAPMVIALRRPREIVGRWRTCAVLLAAMCVVAIGVWLLIWLSYGFRYSMFSPSLEIKGTVRELFPNDGLLSSMGRFAEQNHLLPEAYLYGYSYMLSRTQGSNAFFNGQFSTRGWLEFFPYAVAVKTSLELFLMLAIAAAAGWHFRRENSSGELPNKNEKRNRKGESRLGQAVSQRWLYRLSPLLVLVAVFWVFALTSHFNIGHRHILATYPPMFILAGAAGMWFRQPAAAISTAERSAKSDATAFANGKSPTWLFAIRGLIVFTLVLSIAEALWVWPNYLAYFNLLIGGPGNGYKHLVDSSLDWSQDAKELKRWFDAHPEDVLPPHRVYVSFFGNAPLEFYGIDAIKLPSFTSTWKPNVADTLHGGTYCISATELQNVLLPQCPGRWNKRYEETYQGLRHNIEAYRRSLSDPALQSRIKAFATDQQWNDMFNLFERLRFSRLCSFLREREPDDEVGHSILIYRLSDADIAKALDGPPVELLENPEGMK